MKTTKIGFSLLALTLIGTMFSTNALAQTFPSSTMAPLEQFKVCKNMSVSAVYELGKNSKEGIVVAQLDYNTRMDGELKKAKQHQIQNAVSAIGRDTKLTKANIDSMADRSVAAKELFTALDFYLLKDNTVSLEKMNSHLSQGKITDIVVSCQDKTILKDNEMLGVGEKETTYPVLFSQKI